MTRRLTIFERDARIRNLERVVWILSQLIDDERAALARAEKRAKGKKR